MPQNLAASSVQQQLQYQMQMHVAQQLQLDSSNLDKDDGGSASSLPINLYSHECFPSPSPGRFGRRFSGSSKPPAEPARGVPRPSRCANSENYFFVLLNFYCSGERSIEPSTRSAIPVGGIASRSFGVSQQQHSVFLQPVQPQQVALSNRRPPANVVIGAVPKTFAR